MYLVKGKFKDGTGFSFRTKAEQMGEAAQDFVAALASQKNSSPVERATFIVKTEEANSLKLKAAPKKKATATAGKK